jgi:hypothetical protein
VYIELTRKIKKQSGFLPRRRLPHISLVHARRHRRAHLVLPVCCSALGRFLWSACRCYREYGWRGRIQGLALDLRAYLFNSHPEIHGHTRWLTNGFPQILEGLATIVLGVCCFFWLIDSPALSTTWLDNDEMRFLAIQQRIKDGGNSSSDTNKNNVRWTDLKMVLTDWRLYLQSYIMFCAVACSYGTSTSTLTLPFLETTI